MTPINNTSSYKLKFAIQWVINAERHQDHDRNEQGRDQSFEIRINSERFCSQVRQQLYRSPHEINFPCDRQRTVPASNKVTRNLSRFRARFNTACMRSRRQPGAKPSPVRRDPIELSNSKQQGSETIRRPMVSSLFSLISIGHTTSPPGEMRETRGFFRVSSRISNLFLFPVARFPSPTDDNSIFVSFFFFSLRTRGKRESEMMFNDT